MEHQLRGQHLEQRLAAAGAIDQPRQRRIGDRQRRAPDPLGDDPDAALRHRIGEIGRLHRRRIVERSLAALAGKDTRPGRDEAARQRHTNRPRALEGGGQSGEEGHGFSR